MPLLPAADERGELSSSLGQAATDAAAKASTAPLPGTPRPPIDAPGEGDRGEGDGGEEPELGQERCRSAARELGACASSGRTWLLWRALHSHGGGREGLGRRHRRGLVCSR